MKRIKRTSLLFAILHEQIYIHFTKLNLPSFVDVWQSGIWNVFLGFGGKLAKRTRTKKHLCTIACMLWKYNVIRLPQLEYLFKIEIYTLIWLELDAVLRNPKRFFAHFDMKCLYMCFLCGVFQTHFQSANNEKNTKFRSVTFERCLCWGSSCIRFPFMSFSHSFLPKWGQQQKLTTLLHYKDFTKKLRLFFNVAEQIRISKKKAKHF